VGKEAGQGLFRSTIPVLTHYDLGSTIGKSFQDGGFLDSSPGASEFEAQ